MGGIESDGAPGDVWVPVNERMVTTTPSQKPGQYRGGINGGFALRTLGRMDTRYTTARTHPTTPVKKLNTMMSVSHIPFDEPAAVNTLLGREAASMTAQRITPSPIRTKRTMNEAPLAEALA